VKRDPIFLRVNVQLGEACDVSPYCSLENVVVGPRVQIAQGVQLKNVLVGPDTKIGREVTLYSPDPTAQCASESRVGCHTAFLERPLAVRSYSGTMW
jgi:NDP-sugar pyrophosphorylase family protein